MLGRYDDVFGQRTKGAWSLNREAQNHESQLKCKYCVAVPRMIRFRSLSKLSIVCDEAVQAFQCFVETSAVHILQIDVICVNRESSFRVFDLTGLSLRYD